MVVDETSLSPDDALDDAQADRVFHALADRTRRDIVRQVLRGEASVSALARHYPISLTAVQKHVAVLEEAGLVARRRSGREQIVRAELATVRRAMALLDQYEALWRSRVDRMTALLDDDTDATTPDRPTTSPDHPTTPKPRNTP
ncbi:MAG: ArsR/SmtB family transcription factor [Ilumatobacteraceae bacterium]